MLLSRIGCYYKKAIGSKKQYQSDAYNYTSPPGTTTQRQWRSGMWFDCKWLYCLYSQKFRFVFWIVEKGFNIYQVILRCLCSTGEYFSFSSYFKDATEKWKVISANKSIAIIDSCHPNRYSHYSIPPQLMTAIFPIGWPYCGIWQGYPNYKNGWTGLQIPFSSFNVP